MNLDIDELIENAKNNKKEINASPEKVSVTVRLTVELNSTIEDLAENQLETSKQKMLEAIIKKGVKLVENAFDIDDVENIEKNQSKQKSFHLLNTNKRHNKLDGIRMYEEGIAAAFHGDWKLEIDKINKGDIVFLYENGVGIIAYGVAEGKVYIEDKDGLKDQMHYQNLNNFKKLKEPYKASKIKKVLNRNFVFLKTKTLIHDGEILFEELEKLSKNN